MATIGQALTSPESGWKRIDHSNSLISYDSNWFFQPSDNLMILRLPSDNKAKFYFKGTKIRIISVMTINSSSNIKISIDGIEYTFSTSSSTNVFDALVFEKLNLENKEHEVSIYSNDSTNSAYIRLKAIDIDDFGSIIGNPSKISIKNPTSNRHYSLADKTLIHLPSSSDKNLILHGTESGKEIKLNENFDKMKYVQDTSEVLGSGKTFTHVVDMSNTKINKIIL